MESTQLKTWNVENQKHYRTNSSWKEIWNGTEISLRSRMSVAKVQVWILVLPILTLLTGTQPSVYTLFSGQLFHVLSLLASRCRRYIQRRSSRSFNCLENFESNLWASLSKIAFSDRRGVCYSFFLRKAPAFVPYGINGIPRYFLKT